MADKFDKNNNVNLLEQTELPDDTTNAIEEDDPRLYDNVPHSHRHLKFWPFLILVILILGISTYRFYGNFFNPLKYDVPEELQQLLNQEEQTQRTIAELKENDTDQDGLTDYQEIYQYYTSIFLPDTDSDGLTDAEEVNMGEDPVCPINQSCNLLRLITPNTKLSSIVQDINIDGSLTIQQAAVQEFRKFLLDNGMSQEELDLLTDEDLLAILQIVDESEILDSDQLNASTTPQEIRAFLLTLPGADADEINALNDEELIKIAEELMNI